MDYGSILNFDCKLEIVAPCSPVQGRVSSPCSISIFSWLRLRYFHEFVLTWKWNLVDSLQMSGCKRNPIFEEWSGIASHCSLKRQVTLEKRLWHSKAERKQLVTQLLRLIKVVLVSAILHTHEYKIDHLIGEAIIRFYTCLSHTF